MGQTYGPDRIPLIPVFFFDAGNHKSYGGSGSTVIDMVQNDTGTLNNITVVGSHFNFNGTTSYLDFGAVVSGTTQDIFETGGTIEIWFRPESDGEGDFGRLVETAQSAASGGMYILTREEASGFIKVSLTQFWSGDDGAWKTTNAVVELNKWHHLVIAYDGSSTSNTPTFWIDGVKYTTSGGLDTSSTPTSSFQSDSGNNLYIGNRTITDRTYDGDIALVAYYGKLLSHDEAVSRYNALRFRFTD